jgi:tetratricopeptide (TPR) repeat protein
VPASDGDELEGLWEDAEFKKAFLGSYGIHPDVEPHIGPEDRAVLEAVYPLLGSDPAAAARMLEQARTTESSAMFDFVLGNLAFQDDRMEEAESHYRAAVTKFPAYRRAWRNLGLIQARGERYEDAIGSFTKMIQLGGGDAISYGLLANAYQSKHDHLAAEAAFRQALLLEPDNVNWRIGLARAVVKQEKYEEAVALLGVLLEREPERAEFWLLQANALLGMKQPLRAAENLELVAMLDKATPDTFSLLGDIYVNEGQHQMAASAYLRGIDADPSQPAAKPLRSAEALAERGALPQAGAVASRIREKMSAALTPEDTLRLAKIQARIAVSSGETDDAETLRLLEEVIALDPFDGDVLMLAGRHWADHGDSARAIVYFERAAGIEGFEDKAKLRHAQLLVGDAKYDEALPLLRRVQELEPREQVARYLEQVERLARSR